MKSLYLMVLYTAPVFAQTFEIKGPDLIEAAKQTERLRQDVLRNLLKENAEALNKERKEQDLIDSFMQTLAPRPVVSNVSVSSLPAKAFNVTVSLGLAHNKANTDAFANNLASQKNITRLNHERLCFKGHEGEHLFGIALPKESRAEIFRTVRLESPKDERSTIMYLRYGDSLIPIASGDLINLLDLERPRQDELLDLLAGSDGFEMTIEPLPTPGHFTITHSAVEGSTTLNFGAVAREPSPITLAPNSALRVKVPNRGWFSYTLKETANKSMWMILLAYRAFERKTVRFSHLTSTSISSPGKEVPVENPVVREYAPFRRSVAPRRWTAILFGPKNEYLAEVEFITQSHFEARILPPEQRKECDLEMYAPTESMAPIVFRNLDETTVQRIAGVEIVELDKYRILKHYMNPPSCETSNAFFSDLKTVRFFPLR